MVDRGTSRTGSGTDGTGGRRLIGWKAIGQYLRCTERTARRWEAFRGMPVHRIPGGGRSSVWASADELTGWLQALPSDVQETLRAEAGSDAATPTAATLAPAGATAAPDSQPLRRALRLSGALLLVGVIVALLFVLWNSARRTPTPPAAMARGPYDDDPEAREQYMTARFELSTRSAESLQAAEQGFHALVQSYPDRAAGWSGLADTYLLLREFGSMHDEVAYPQAERAARTALALDPKLADAWLDQAFVAWWWHGDAASAFHAFDTALQLDPSSAKGLHWYATALYAHGDYEKSLQTIARARALDPNNRAIVADEGWLRFGSGDRGTGIATLERLTQLDRSFEAPHYYLAHAYLIMGRDTDFLREARLAAELRGQAETIDVLGLAEQRFRSGGRQAMLEQLSASEAESCAHGTGSPVIVAEYRALANDREGMLTWLAKAETVHDHNLAPLRGYPEFAAYRSDPEFEKIVHRLP
ncbi:MAG TPA: tetratricopeptide repeat protein [Steroidobacteraceae bacterium]